MSLFSDVVKVVNLQGKLKSNKKQASELFFDFPINNIGRLESEVEILKKVSQNAGTFFFSLHQHKSEAPKYSKKKPTKNRTCSQIISLHFLMQPTVRILKQTFYQIESKDLPPSICTFLQSTYKQSFAIPNLLVKCLLWYANYSKLRE